MELEKVGTLPVSLERLKQVFPDVRPGISAAVKDISIANSMSAAPSVPRSSIPKPGEAQKGLASVLNYIVGTAPTIRKNPLDVLIELLVSKDKSKILALVPPSRTVSEDCFSASPPETPVAHPCRSPSRAEPALPLESVALYTVPAWVGNATAAIQP